MSQLSEFQEAVGAWQLREFGETNERSVDRSAMIVGEEGGEVLRAALKAGQDIRGGTDHWMNELQIEAADVVIAAAGLAMRAGFSLEDALRSRWETVRHREYADVPTGGTCECGAPRHVHRWGVYGMRQDKTKLDGCDGFKLADPATEWGHPFKGDTDR